MSNSAKTVAWVAGGIFILILLFISYSGGHMMGGAGFGQTPGGMPGGMMDGAGGFTTLWAAWMIVPALFWAAVVGLIGWLLIRMIGDSERRVSPEPPEEVQDPASIAARRLAEGEIEVEEYERIVSTLRAHSAKSSGPGVRQVGQVSHT